MPDIFVPADKSLAHLFPAPGADLRTHRMRVKMWLLATSPMECPGCRDEMLICHMHEGIISRAEVMGLWWNVLIHTPYNCILLCGECNNASGKKHAPARNKVLTWKCEQFGTAEIARWTRSLPFKIHPLRGWLERH